MRARLVTTFLLLGAALAHADDSITLKSGDVVRGKIAHIGETVIQIDTVRGAQYVRRTDVKSYHREPPPKPPAKPVQTRTEELPAKEVPAQGDRVRKDSDRRASQRKDTESAREVRTSEPREQLDQDIQAVSVAPREVDATSEVLAKVLLDLGSKERAKRVEAATWVVENWPASTRVVDSALAAPSETTRVEAVRLLEHERLGDTSRRLRSALADASPLVRTTALRAARHGIYPVLERQIIDLMRQDPEWVVRQEAIRTLEDLGTRKSLQPVLSAWSLEPDKNRKRRYRRVLRALLEHDFGSDAVAWRKAVDEVHLGKRTVRGD